MADPLYHHFKNSDDENDHRVRLVPRSPDSTLTPKEGELEGIVDLGVDGYGFCLSKKASISCVGAQPTTVVYHVQNNQGTTGPEGNVFIVDGVELEDSGLPTWLSVNPTPVDEEVYQRLGIDPEQFQLAALEFSSASPAAHRFELKFLPADQDVISFVSEDPMVLITETGFGVCLQGAAPEPVCNWARIGLAIKPDLFYSDPKGDDDNELIGNVYDVEWTILVNGVALPQVAKSVDGSYLEEILETVPGIIAGYAHNDGGSATYMANDTDEAIKIRLVPNKLYPPSRVDFFDIPTEAILAQLQESNPSFDGLVHIEHGSVFMAEDGSINICLAPKGTIPPKGISCEGASPYLITVLAINPNYTVPVSGLNVSVDDVSYGYSLPAEMFEYVPAADLETATGFTRAQVLAFAKETGNIPDDWNIMLGGLSLNTTADNHIVKVNLTPPNQNQYRYLFYSPWGNQLYPDGGMGLCVSEGASIPKPSPFQCGSGTNAVFVKTPNGTPNNLQGTFRLLNGNSIYAESDSFLGLIDIVNNHSSQQIRMVSVGDVGFGIQWRSFTTSNQVKLVLSNTDHELNVFEFYDIALNADFDTLFSEGAMTVVDALGEPELSTNSFYDPVDFSIKACLANFKPNTWWLEGLNEDGEIITELENGYVDVAWSWDALEAIGIGNISNLNVTIDNQSIATLYSWYAAGSIRFNVGSAIGTTNITITHRDYPYLPPLTFKLVKKAPMNNVILFSVGDTGHRLTDADGRDIGQDNSFNLTGGEEGTIAYIPYTTTYESSSDYRGIDPDVFKITVVDPAVADVELVPGDTGADFWDGMTTRHLRKGMFKVTYKQAGTTNVSFVPKRAKAVATIPIQHHLTTFAITTDALLEFLPKSGRDFFIEIQGGSGVVNWGDGVSEPYQAETLTQLTHSYASGLNGQPQLIRIQTSDQMELLRGSNIDNVLKWPDAGVVNFQLNAAMSVPAQLPNGLTSLANAFKDNIYFNQDISSFDTSNVTDFSYMLSNAKRFDRDIGNLNTSNGVNFSHALEGTAVNFVINWDFSNAVDLSYMLYNATSMTCKITKPNMHKVTNMDYFAYNTLNWIGFAKGNTGSQSPDEVRYIAPSLAHLEVPLVSTRPSHFRGPEGASLRGIGEPEWGVIPTWYGEVTYTIDPTRGIPVGTYMSLNTYKYDGDSKLMPDWSGILVMEIDGVIKDSVWLGIPGTYAGMGYNLDVKAGAPTDREYTVKFKVSSPNAFSSINFPLGTSKVLDWSTFKVSAISGLGYATQVPPSLNESVRYLRNTFEATPIANVRRTDIGFNHPNIANWDMVNIRDCGSMFIYNRLFNQPVGNGSFYNCTDFSYMFFSASAFNQDLTQWCTGAYGSRGEFATGSALTPEHLPNWGTCSMTWYQGFKVRFTDSVDWVTYPLDVVPDDFAATVETPTKKIVEFDSVGGSCHTIGERAFTNIADYQNPRAFTIGSNMRTIKKDAFKDAWVGIKILEGLETVEDGGLWINYGDYYNNAVKFPKSLKTLGKKAVAGKYITIQNSDITMVYDSVSVRYDYGYNYTFLSLPATPPLLDQPFANTYPPQFNYQGIRVCVPNTALTTYQNDIKWGGTSNVHITYVDISNQYFPN